MGVCGSITVEQLVSRCLPGRYLPPDNNRDNGGREKTERGWRYEREINGKKRELGVGKEGNEKIDDRREKEEVEGKEDWRR